MLIGINGRHLAEPGTGLGQFTHDLARALTAAAPENLFLFYIQAGMRIPAPLPGDNWRIVEIPIADRERFDRLFTEDPAFLARIPDVLHVIHLTMPVNRAGVPVLLTIHDIIPAAFLKPSLLLRGRTPLRSLTSLGVALRLTAPARVRQASAVTTISETSARDIRRILRYRGPLAVIPPGMDRTITGPPGPEAVRRAQNSVGIRPPYLINFGGLAFRKNIRRQIHAFTRIRRDFPELAFVIVGDGFWHKRLAKKNTPGVHFTGKIPRETLRGLLHGALFSSYMSLYEGFGLPVLESLGSGIPALTSVGTSTSEILPGRTRLADPYSSGSIAEGMRELIINNEAWRRRLAEQEDPSGGYSWEENALRYLELYRRVIK